MAPDSKINSLGPAAVQQVPSLEPSGHTVSISRSGKHGVEQSIAIDLETPTAPSVTVKPASAVAEPARVRSRATRQRSARPRGR